VRFDAVGVWNIGKDLFVLKTRPVIQRWFPVLIGCILLLPSSSAFAQGLGDVLTTYQNATNGWITKVLAYANNLFLLLAGIEFAWTAIILLFEQQSLEGWVAAFIKKLMAISFFYALLTYAQTWIPAIINSFTQIGQDVGGTRGLSADGLIGEGWNLASKIFEAGANIKPNPLTNSIDFLFVALFGAIAVVIIICFIAMALQFVMTQVEGYIVISAGLIYLGFGGSRWTSSYAERFLGTAVTTGIRIMTFFLIVGLGQALDGTSWTPAVTDIVNMINKHNIPGYIGATQQAFTLGAGVIIFTTLALQLPKIAGGVISGSAGLSTGDLAGTMAAAAGAGAAAASLLAGQPELAGAAKAAGGAAGAGGSGAAMSAGRAAGSAGSAMASGGSSPMAPGGAAVMTSLDASAAADVAPPQESGGPPASGERGMADGSSAMTSPQASGSIDVAPPQEPGTSASSSGQGMGGSGTPMTFDGAAAMTSPAASGSIDASPSQESGSHPPSTGQGAGRSFGEGFRNTAASVDRGLRSVQGGLDRAAKLTPGNAETLPPPTQSNHGG
jgi:type IV secretion system protein TrbL